MMGNAVVDKKDSSTFFPNFLLDVAPTINHWAKIDYVFKVKRGQGDGWTYAIHPADVAEVKVLCCGQGCLGEVALSAWLNHCKAYHGIAATQYRCNELIQHDVPCSK